MSGGQSEELCDDKDTVPPELGPNKRGKLASKEDHEWREAIIVTMVSYRSTYFSERTRHHVETERH